MAKRLYSNVGVETALSADITNSQLTATIDSATDWPVAPFTIEIGSEVILVGARTTTALSSLTRGYDGTTQAAHLATSTVRLVVVAADFSLIWDHVHTGAGGDDTAAISHADLSTVTSDQHHPQLHTIASHSDTSATGAELNELTDGSLTVLHVHGADYRPAFLLGGM